MQNILKLPLLKLTLNPYTSTLNTYSITIKDRGLGRKPLAACHYKPVVVCNGSQCLDRQDNFE